MKVRIICLLSVATTFFMSCINQENKDNQNDRIIVLEDTVSTKNILVQEQINEEIEEDEEDFLQGVWAESEEENAAFRIVGKQIQYFDDIENSKEDYTTYLFENGLLTIFDGEDTITFYKVIKLSKDSLVYQTEWGDTVNLYNRKRKANSAVKTK